MTPAVIALRYSTPVVSISAAAAVMLHPRFCCRRPFACRSPRRDDSATAALEHGFLRVQPMLVRHLKYQVEFRWIVRNGRPAPPLVGRSKTGKSGRVRRPPRGPRSAPRPSAILDLTYPNQALYILCQGDKRCPARSSISPASRTKPPPTPTL